MYKEGRQLVQEINKEIEGVVKDYHEAEKKAKGFIGFLVNIFGSKPKIEPKIAEKAQKTPAKAVKTKNKAPAFDENLIFQQVSDSLIKFFQAYNGLKNYIKEQEELALHSTSEEGNEIAIKLVIANLQMEKLNTELSDYMVYHVPAELKDLYTRVNQKIGQIANIQAMARREEMLKERRARWQRQEKISLIQNRAVAILITVAIVSYAWILILTMTHSPSY